MKIVIQDQGVMQADIDKNIADLEKRDAEGKLTNADDLKTPEVALDDTAFDEPGWISLEIGGVSVAAVHIDDLLPAVLSSNTRYKRAMYDKRNWKR